jgi:hypothetical protein
MVDLLRSVSLGLKCLSRHGVDFYEWTPAVVNQATELFFKENR